MVLRQDQEDRGGEEAPDGSERTRCFPHPRFGVSPERLLAIRPRRRHRQALPDPTARRRRIFHCQTDNF